jgi:cation diffusion facilitator family transporter
VPPDEQHRFGHEKAEYFSAGVEGGLILLAAISIGWAAVARLITPQALEDIGLGAVLSGTATAVNLVVGILLIRAGKRHRSITVEADGRHLLTDVWTSVGVIAGVLAVGATGWRWLDPVVALLVALNIVVTGSSLLRRAGAGLMDRALPAAERAALERCSTATAASACPSTASAPARPGAGPSSRCTSSCRARGPSPRRTPSPTVSSGTSSRRCPVPR